MIKLSEKIGYGFGDMASSMFWKLFGTYLMIFYTDVYGLEAAAVGTMFLVTRVWDSFFDPLVGILSDRTKSRFGKFRPYLFYVAVPFGVIGVITFFTPDFGHTGKLIYAYLTYSLMMMVYSLINVPYASLLGVMTPNPAERTVLSSYRMLFAYLGSLIAYLIFMPLIGYFSGGDPSPEAQQTGWTMAVAVIAVMCIVLFLGCGALTRERIQSNDDDEEKRSLKQDVNDLLHNTPWWLLFGASVGLLVFFSIRDGATLYYFKYFLVEEDIGGFSIFSLSFTLSSLFLAVGQITNIIGVLLAAPVSNRFGKKVTFATSSIIMMALSCIFYYFDANDLVLIFVFGSLISICGGMLFPIMWSMYADCSDYSESKTGNRATGLIFSASSMSQKLGWALGSAITGWLLSYFGFQANMVQDEETIHGIKLFQSYLPAAAALISVLFIIAYPLGSAKMKEITRYLATKRSQHAAKKHDEKLDQTIADFKQQQTQAQAQAQAQGMQPDNNTAQ